MQEKTNMIIKMSVRKKNQLLNAMTEEMNSLKINFAEKSSKMQKFIRHHKNRCDKDFENLLTVTRKWKTKYFHLRNDLQQLQENGNVETHQLNDKVQYLENCVWNLSGQLQESDYNLNLLHQSSQDRENSLVTKLMDARIKFQNDKKLMQDNLNKVQQLFDSKEVAKAQNLYDSNLDMKAKISDLYESLSKVRLELQEATDKLQKERNENVKNVSNLNKSMMEFKNKPYWNEDDWYEFYSYQKNWLSQYHFEETEPENESCVITPAPHIVGKSHNHVTYGTLFATDLPNSDEDSKSEEDNSANQSDQDMIKEIKFLENKLNNSSLKQADRNRLRTQIKKLKESSPSYEEDFKLITNSNEYGRRSIYAPMFNPYTDAHYGFPVPTQGNRSYL
ncbi:unnamed protein product [Meganyctiphanes norvegica]|uniref:Uncharacterized protein n=1 Tax=Meganyctiphanes norvegica TaxID=48144 RepID=A0AAV2QY35_MEGNR